MFQKQIEEFYITGLKNFDEKLLSSVFIILNLLKTKKVSVQMMNYLTLQTKLEIIISFARKISDNETRSLTRSNVSCNKQ